MKRWVPLSLIALGALGLGVSSFREIRSAARTEVQGSFWMAEDRWGGVKSERHFENMVLKDGERIRLKDPEGEGRTYESCSFVARREQQATFMEFVFREKKDRALVLRITPAMSPWVLLAQRDAQGRLSQLASQKDTVIRQAF